MFAKKTIEDLGWEDVTALVRVDFNVPLENGRVGDDTRIKAALPTVHYLLNQGAGVILMSHLGRPGGEYNEQYSLQPVAKELEKLLGVEVMFIPDCRGKKAREAAEQIQPGQVALLENTRFYPGEKANDPEMARELASYGEVFVNDAFGTAHRKHASNVGVAEHLPAVAGYLLEKEIVYLGRTIENPEKPFIAVLGGAKVSGKIGVIQNLIGRTEKILIGGGMANTFFKAMGLATGDSLVEAEAVDTAGRLLDQADEKIILPSDIVIADGFSEDAEYKTIPLGDVPDGWQILDIGEETIQKFSAAIQDAGTVVWNGPMGVFEMEPFAAGTYQLTKAVASSSAVTIIGGGDSASAVRKSGLADQITHISTGGGASLQMLEGSTLPGLAALDDK
jgi:phosphoglycerate kinase